jgi:hypothetical protein
MFFLCYLHGAVMHEESLDTQRILCEQQKDEFCTKKETSNYSGKREFFLD